MFTFFDFMFFSVYKWYAEHNDDSSEFAGSCAVSGFQAFNISSAIWIYGYFLNDGQLYLSKAFAGILIGCLIILNYIRYIRISKFSKDAIEAKWKNRSLEYQKKFRSFLLFYIIISLTLFIGFIVYSARKAV